MTEAEARYREKRRAQWTAEGKCRAHGRPRPCDKCSVKHAKAKSAAAEWCEECLCSGSHRRGCTKR